MRTPETQRPTVADEFDPFAGPALALSAPSSESQREIWTATRMGDDASCAFNESCSLRLVGPLDRAAFRGALADLVQRHEALRTTFSPDGTTLCVAEALSVAVPVVDLAGLQEAERAAREARLLAEEVERPFDLEVGPLVRFHLLQRATDEHVLVFTAHHIVCDGFSTAVLMTDLAALYDARRKGTTARLPAPFPFSAYSRELAEWQRSPDHAAAEKFWVERFKGALPVLDLPCDRPRPRLKSYPSRRYDHRIGKETLSAAKKAGAKAGASFFVTLLGALEVLLHRLSGQDDLVVGIPAAGQAATGHPLLVGHCVNTLPIRVQVDGDAPFTSLLGRVRTAMLDAQDHQLYTFGSLLRALAVPRDPSRLPLVSAFFNIDQGFLAESLPFDGLESSFCGNPRHFENFDLFVNAVGLRGEVVLECQYNTDLFDEATVRRWLQAYERILAEVTARPDLALDRIPIVSPEDGRRMAAWNETRRDYPRERLLHELVEAQVDRTPDAVAVTSGAEPVTYRDLERRANQLARHLRTLGAGPEIAVGLSLQRSIDMMVALLAVQKAGAAYVPLDPAFPAERLAYMVADSGMPLILTQHSLRAALPPHKAQVVEIDTDWSAIADQPPERLPASARPDNLAYVLYTSGSTGKPKGVQVPISAVVNFLWSVRAEPGLCAADRLVAVTTLSFDIAVLELWLPLVVGAEVVLATHEVAGDGVQLRDLLERARATAMQATPATWRLLLGAGWEGSQGFKAICGGEALPLDLAELLVARSQLWNMYGPTETTVWSTGHRVPRPPGPIVIGRPLANTEAHVLDRFGEPVPIGVPGELYIGGDGVTRGYLNRPELTAERFLPDPHRNDPLARMYRTGDVVRLRDDGTLEFFGRNDAQVKVRGFRIELGEVEAALARHSSVEHAVAMAREDRQGDVRLVAYVVPRRGEPFSEEALRAHVRGILPEYMVPQHGIRMDAFPLTPNGKIDRRALPAPDLGARSDGEYLAPRDAGERLLATLWQEALGVARIGIHDDFFALGGHSLLAAQVIARLGREHGISLPMRKLFEAPTLAKFAPLLLSGERKVVRIPRLPEGAAAPADFMQERMWNLEQLQPGRAVFNFPGAFRLRGPLDVGALERSLDAFLRRHDATRTTLRAAGDEVVQVIGPEIHLSLEPTDSGHLATQERERELERILVDESVVPFDLEKGPLIRARLFRLGPTEHVLFFVCHHAIWDGWSTDVLLRDLAELYAAEREGRAPKLPALPIRFRDFSAWHREWLASPEVEKQAEYWRAQLGGQIPPLDLPTDRPRTRAIGDAGATLWIEIPRAETDELTALGQRYGATPFMVVLAAYAIALYRYSGQDDLLVGTPVRGRAQPETEDMVGTFINTLVLRNRFDGAPSFADVLARIKTTVREAFAHEDVPFELLAMSQKPIFNALFSFQDARGRSPRLGDLEVSQVHVQSPVAANDVSLWIWEEDFGLVGDLNFSSALFDAATMERFLDCFRMVLRGAVADSTQPVARIPIAPEGQRSSAGEPLAGPVPLPHQALERFAAATPSAPALVEDGRTLSYAELRARVGALAGRLVASGVGPGVRVGLLAGLTADGAVGALALGWLGATTAVLDPAEPPERLHRLLADEKLRWVLAAPDLRGLVPAGVEVISLDGTAGGAPPPAAVGGGLRLYVPTPDGATSAVELSLSTLAAAVDGVRRAAGLVAADVLLATSAPASGQGLAEVCLALAAGAQAVLDEAAGDSLERLRERLAGATALCAPAWIWQRLVDAGWQGGPGFKALSMEPPPPELARALAERAGAALALHGDAETGVWALCGRLSAAGPVRLAPLPGVQLEIRDAHGEPLPWGVPGELWASGATLSGHAAGPLHRTGERARLRAGGIELLGRQDGRLLLRGRRVEPREIERALAGHPALREVAVAARPDAYGEPRLVGFVVRKPDADATDSELRAHLRERLPRRLVPRHYMELPALPRAHDGTDRAALPSPFRMVEAGTQVMAPRTEAEKLLAGLWREALALPQVGRRDNFFDLGGHSLVCLQVVAQIEKRTGRKLSPRVLLLNTLEQVAAQLPGKGSVSADQAGEE
jgi:amino acid adenylation domain-containing protein